MYHQKHHRRSGLAYHMALSHLPQLRTWQNARSLAQAIAVKCLEGSRHRVVPSGSFPHTRLRRSGLVFRFTEALPIPAGHLSLLKKTSQDCVPSRRPAHTAAPLGQKRVRISSPSQYHTTPEHNPTPTVQHTVIEPLPALPKKSETSIVVKPNSRELSVTASRTRSLPARAKGAGRFKPLTILGPQSLGETPLTKRQQDSQIGAVPRSGTVFCSLPGMTSTPPTLVSISLLPNISERRQAHRWAVILSGLDDNERQVCSFVSRTFHYAGKKLHPYAPIV